MYVCQNFDTTYFFSSFSGDLRGMARFTQTSFQNRLFDDLREIPVFQFMYPGGKVVGGVCREHRAFGLKDDSALVVVIIDIMNGDAAFLFCRLQ